MSHQMQNGAGQEASDPNLEFVEMAKINPSKSPKSIIQNAIQQLENQQFEKRLEPSA